MCVCVCLPVNAPPPLPRRFPKDVRTYGIDRQFLWGRSLLVTPVLDPGVDYVDGYFPEGLWYDFYTVSPAPSTLGPRKNPAFAGTILRLSWPLNLLPPPQKILLISRGV